VLRLRDEATAALKATAAATAEVEKRSAALEAQVRELGAELDSVRRSGQNTSRGLGDLDEAAGKVGSSAAKMRGVLSLLPGPMGNVAGLANDAADGVEVLSGMLGLSLGPVAVVAAAVAALGVAYMALAADAKKAEEAQQRAAKAAEVAEEKFARLAAIKGQVTDAYLVATEQETAASLKLRDVTEDLRSQFGPLIAEQRDRQADAETRGAAAREKLAEATRRVVEQEAVVARHGAGALSLVTEQRKLDLRRAAQATLAAEVAENDRVGIAAERAAAAYEAKWGDLAAKAAQGVLIASKEGDAAGRAADKVEDHAEATREASAATSEWAAGMLALVAAWDRVRADRADVSPEQAGLAYLEKRVAEQERLNALAEEELATAEALAATRTPSAMLGAAAGYISAPLQSGAALDPSGTASAILALAEALGSLDETMASIYSVTVDEETGTREQGGLVGDILGNVSGKGAATLGAWVAQVIGDALPALARGIPDFVAGLVESLPAILEAIARAIPGLALALVEQFVLLAPRVGVALAEVLLDPETWIGIGEAFIDAIGEAIDRLVQGIVDIVTGAAAATGDGSQPTIFEGDWWEQAGQDVESFFAGEGRSKASGATYIDRGGLYMLHAGETVQTAAATTAASGGGLAGARGRMRGSGGRVVVEIDADSLADALGAMSRRGYAVGG
jgi:hypothetical protein